MVGDAVSRNVVWEENGENMRTVFIGAGKVSVETAKELIKKGHEVVIIDIDKAKIDELSKRWIAASCRAMAVSQTSCAK